ncbi:CYFA0S05e00166g1_1 [Cyberlindnera fabianii]|uniref:CYFA0S05e00166g1_1 n=1 Tax=Cyberlindnera fabianii TaxID=36022 RepID=A0A061AYB7_CYBFA|nr:Protein STE50 [Cyberlindnera fabianii]CDR40384.1 CYFA0S05e00166g1_1 [Cyberlindnera fabianii]
MDDESTLRRVPEALQTHEVPFTEWGPVELENWLSRCSFSNEVVTKFTNNNITGDTLAFLHDDHLQEMDLSIQERVRLKIEINKLLATNKYVAPADEANMRAILTNISTLIQQTLDQTTKGINDEIIRLRDDIKIWNMNKPLPTPEKNALPSSPFNITSPTKAKATPSSSSSAGSPSETSTATLRKVDRRHSQRGSTLFSSANPSSQNLHSPTAPSSSSPQTTSVTTLQSKPVSEPLKQLRASTDDPCSKILQAAMKRHKLNDDWRNYALVICYGDQERILELDEKPVQIFKELKEKGEHPAIMLRQKADFSGKKLSETPGGKL